MALTRLIWAPRSNLSERISQIPVLRDMATCTGDQNSIRSVRECGLGAHAMEEELSKTSAEFHPEYTVLVQLRMSAVHSLLGQYINVLEYNTRVSILS